VFVPALCSLFFFALLLLQLLDCIVYLVLLALDHGFAHRIVFIQLFHKPP
jgi:hypothetical protein